MNSKRMKTLRYTVAKRCPPLRYFRNGQASGYSRDVGTTVKFVCNAGYKFSTDTDGSITCQNNYKWSADQPQCLRDEYVKSASESFKTSFVGVEGAQVSCLSCVTLRDSRYYCLSW